MSLGPYSIVLLIGMVQGIVFAFLLATQQRNRAANRCLALLLVLFVVSLIPSTIGFAGAYDHFPWLTFAPFVVTLGFGPALWLYVHQLTHERLPKYWWLHLVPVLGQLTWYAAVFAQPLNWRYEFLRDAFEPIGSPLEAVLGLISAAAYWVAAFRLKRRYSAWAPQHVSDSENYNLGWLRNFLIGTALGFGVWAGFEVVNEAIQPLSYVAFFWLDLVGAIILYTFAVAGYRHSELAWPGMDAVAPPPFGPERAPAQGPEIAPEPDPEPKPGESPQAASERAYDWDTLAEEYRVQMSQMRWYLDADLTLASLARHLSTNDWTLSRAINEGAGCNFNDFVNVYRVDAVCERLADPSEGRSLLELAMECGFNSKTSFNRSFKKLKGETPSECRKRLREGATS